MTRLYRILAKKAIGGLILLLMMLPASAWGKLPSDPNFVDQQAMWEQINAPSAWDFTTGSARVVVATIDTGVDTSHSDLRTQIWTNPRERADNGIDDDDNGYIDDVHGWNFVEDNNDVRTSVFDSADDPEIVRHGTIIAGLIGAAGNNGTLGVGVNWNVKIMPLRALQSSGTGLYSTIARAVDYAADNGASVISLSFEGDINNSVLRGSLHRAYQKGVVIVTAAGNHDPQLGGDLDLVPRYPACYDLGDATNWIITVAAVDAFDRLSDFSNYGGCVDISAPGENIFSTERYAPQFGYNKEFGGGWNGTSFAAPLVAGTAALIRGLHPEWTPDQVIKIILDNTSVVESSVAGVSKMGHGRLNVGAAVAAAAAIKSDVFVGRLFFSSGNVVKHIDTVDAVMKTAAIVNDATLRAVAVKEVGDRATLALLIKRDAFYYVQIIDSAGALIREIPLKIGRKIADTAFDFFVTSDDVNHFIVASYDVKKKLTTFSEIDETGAVIKEVSVAGAVTRWTMNEVKNTLVTANVSNNKLTITQIPWGSPARYRWQTSRVTAIDDIKMTRLDQTGGEFIVLIVRDGNKVKQLSFDSKFLGVTQEIISAQAPPGSRWKLLVLKRATGSQSVVVRFNPDGGTYSYTNNNGVEIGSFWLPALPANYFK